MTKRAYVGVSGKARKVKKIYLGVEEKARKVKRGYIGVGGVARPFWSGDGLTHYGTVTPLSRDKSYLAATTVGDYALFGGVDFPSSNAVDAYARSLTRSTPSPLSKARSRLAATAVGDYALFGGGGRNYTVDAYTVA